MSCTTCLESAADPASPVTCPDCGASRLPVTTPDTGTPTSGPVPSLPPTLGRYRLSTELGRGGSAIVVRAHDMELDREIALKVLPPDPLLRGSRPLRFEREGRALAGLQHPRVVMVHDVGEEDGFHFMAMDLMEGTLADHLPARDSRPGPERVRRALQWMLQACEGLAALHGRGLIHRDVKPSNLLLGPDGEVRVADLGVALLPGESTLTLTGHGVGTIAYSAPEQLEGGVATAASDVYGLGATLHALLTGRPPALRGEVSMDGLPRDVRPVLRRALATDPGQRYPSVEVLAADLRRALRGRGARRARAVMASGLVFLAVSATAISWLTADGPAPASIVLQARESAFKAEAASLSLRARGYRWEDLLAGGVAGDEQELEIAGVIHHVRLVPQADRVQLELHGPEGLLAVQELPSAGTPTERWRLHVSPVDVDGDGFDDTLLKASAELLMVKWEPQALRRPELGWRRRLTAPLRECSPTIVDYDGDGKLEVLVGDAPPGRDELSRSTIHALDFNTGKTKRRWILPTTEAADSAPQALRTAGGRVERVYLDTRSSVDHSGGKLFGLEPDGHLSELDLPAGGMGRITRPRFVDADGDGRSDLIFSRHDGTVTCVPAAAPSRPHWTRRIPSPGRVSVVLSQQDGDPLPEACLAFDEGFECLNVEPDASSRIEWAADVAPAAGFVNGCVEVPDLNGDGLSEIAVSAADAGIHVFSRAAEGGSLAVLSLPEDLPGRATFVARPVVLSGDESGSVRVIGVTTKATVACWNVSANEVDLKWAWKWRLETGDIVTATPRVVRWHGEDGRERLGVLVLTAILHLFELDDSGLPRPVWSSWSPMFSGWNPGDGTPAVHRDRDGLWVVFTRTQGEVCKVPLRPSSEPVQPAEVTWPPHRATWPASLAHPAW